MIQIFWQCVEKILILKKALDDLLTQQLNPNTRIVTYRGDQKVATEYVLMNLLGVVPELIGKDYPRDSKTTPLLRSFIDEHHYPQDKHCFSDSYRQDDEKNTVLWHRYAEDFYTYLYDKLGDGQDHKKEIAQLINGSWINDNDCAVFKKIVDTMGVEAYHQAVTEYNQEIQAKIDQGIYPTNKAIMNGAPLGIASEKQDTK